ncbi:amidohydrolase family protein, partial [Pseudomonadota bacterium]|nr:amidohydrolase family protein [Pseudomonadota bacterium]
KSATIESAKLLRMDDRLGRIQPNMLADIIGMAKNPLDDISAVSDIGFIMKDGVIFKNNL